MENCGHFSMFLSAFVNKLQLMKKKKGKMGVVGDYLTGPCIVSCVCSLPCVQATIPSKILLYNYMELLLPSVINGILVAVQVLNFSGLDP